MKLISIVLPCHNEGENIIPLINELIRQIPKKYKTEYICVDDGSNDHTSQVIRELSRKNKNVRGIIFHRNFGHQKALMAGVLHAQGDAVITMDSDFQHPPKIVPKLIKYWENGYDLVKTQKAQDPSAVPTMKLLRTIGYPIWNWITDKTIIPGGSDFRLISKPIVRYLSEMNESEFFLRGNVHMAARRSIIVKYNVGTRKHGRSSYSLKMFINMFINGFISFSTKPLRGIMIFGLCLFFVTFVLIIIDIIYALIIGRKIVEGWITGVLVVIFLNSVIMIYLGLMSEYIAVIFKEVKKRPRYIISDKINFK